MKTHKYNIALFNFWVESNYNKIVAALKSNNMYNQDALHDSFIDIHSDVSTMQNDIEYDYLSKCFKEAYKRNSLRQMKYEKTQVYFETSLFEMVISFICQDVEYVSVDKDKIYQQVNKYINANLSDKERSLLAIYLKYPSLSFRGLSQYTGIPYSTLYRYIHAIKTQIRKNVRLYN